VRGLTLLALLALSCAPALRSRAPGALPEGTPAVSGEEDPAVLLAEARTRLAGRAEPGEAAAAEELFLAAAKRDANGVEGFYGAVQARIWRIGHDASVVPPSRPRRWTWARPASSAHPRARSATTPSHWRWESRRASGMPRRRTGSRRWWSTFAERERSTRASTKVVRTGCWRCCSCGRRPGPSGRAIRRAPSSRRDGPSRSHLTFPRTCSPSPRRSSPPEVPRRGGRQRSGPWRLPRARLHPTRPLGPPRGRSCLQNPARGGSGARA
jgi:hypothetical protein